jgi:hypothetical protein
VVALAGGVLDRQQLVSDLQAAADAARDLVAGRQAVGVGDAVRLPLELERHGSRPAALAAQERGWILVHFARRLEQHAEALERTRASVLGVDGARSHAQILALGQCGGPVDDRDRRPFGSADARRVPAHAEVWVGADADIRAQRRVGGDGVEVPALVPELL